MTGPQLIALQSIPDAARGTLCIAQAPNLPFQVKRYFTMNGVDKGVIRGDHAHKAQYQYFNCLHGSFEIVVEGKTGKQVFILDRPETALNVPPLHWVTVTSGADGSIMMICASDLYDKADYIFDRAEFARLL